MIPAKADPEQQASFLKARTRTPLAEAQAGQRAVFFVDAAHFVLAPFLGFLWSLVARVHPGPRRAATLQRSGGLECGHARTHYGDQ